MVRPPPLQLRIDNYLPNLGLRPKRSFLTRAYDIDWRMAVIAVTAINALRYFVLGVGGFGDRDVDEERESVVRFVVRSSFPLCSFVRMFEGLWRKFRVLYYDCVKWC
jgi:hypothetical protein